MFDLNIDHYSKNDIEELFNLKGTLYNNEDVEDSMNTIKEQMDHEVGVDVKVKDATLNFLLTAKKLLIDVQPDLITNQVLDEGNNFLIQKPKQKPSDVGYSDQPYYRGTLNPVQRRVNEVLINVDSRFRDSPTSLSTDFVISLPDLVKNVISMQVKSVEEITGHYQISDKLQNDFFYQGDTLVEITSGNYTIDTLITELTSATTDLTWTALVSQNKISVENSSGSDIDLNFAFTRGGNADNLPNLPLRFGWLLGCDGESVTVLAGQTYTFSKRVQLERVKYANIIIDDFQNNFYQTVLNGTNSYIQNSNIIARVANVNSDIHIETDSPERKYFGPVDIQRLKIQIVDEYGRVIDTNGDEVSFSLLLKTQYDM